jgi:DNA-binding XRE family transcriptional regulator
VFVDFNRVVMIRNHSRKPPREVSMRLEPQVVQKDDLNRRVAGIVRRKREEQNLTQSELADAANMSRTSIAFIESAKQECGLETFVKVALALQMEPHLLLQEVWTTWELDNVEDAFAQKVLKKATR